MFQPDFTDKLISSADMEVGNDKKGKSNVTYSNSKSFEEIPMSKQYNHSSSVPNGGSYNNHASFDRMCSTVSQYTTGNSVLKLVLDDDRPEITTKFFTCRLKTAFWLLLSVSLVIIVTLTTLYVLKTNAVSSSQNNLSTGSKIDTRIPCFHRVKAKKIKDIQKEPEIIEAIENSSKEIFQAFHSNKDGYHAFSLSISYMGERLWSMDYGKMDFRKNDSKSPNQDTKYPIASITKLFTVLMLEMLVENGTIQNIDDEITKYEPTLHIQNPFNNDKVTFRQLACMMSGLSRESPCYPHQRENYCPYNNAEMLIRINNTVLVLPPDQSPSYSNLGITILGRILERQLKNNQTYEKWITQNIINPLNMTNTGFDILEREHEYPVSTAKPHILAKIVDWGWNTPCGGLYSTATDLGKLGRLFATDHGSDIVSQKIIKRLLKPEFLWSDGDAQGCPFEIHRIDPTENKIRRTGYMMYAKSGTIFGYVSKINIVPEMKLNINVLSARSEGNYGDIMNHVSKIFVKAVDKMLRRKEQQYTLPDNYGYYIGSYRQNTSWPLIQNPCNISYTDGKLRIHLEWLEAPLIKSHNKNDYILKPAVQFLQVGCFMLGDGIFREKYYFDSPKAGRNKSSGFYINGISSYGYVRFERIDD